METFFRLNETDSTQVEEEVLTNVTEDPLYYRLNSFIITKGKLKFTDATTSEPFIYNLTNIEMAVESVDSKSEWVKTHSEMLLNKRGVMKADLAFNPLDPMELELKYIISGFY